MASYDFEVDLQALVSASQGASETIELLKDKDVEDLVPSEDSLGHDELWSAVEEFKDRWERGTKDMADDIEEAAGRLGQVAMTYGTFDQEGMELLKGVAGQVRGFRLMGGSGA